MVECSKLFSAAMATSRVTRGRASMFVACFGWLDAQQPLELDNGDQQRVRRRKPFVSAGWFAKPCDGLSIDFEFGRIGGEDRIVGFPADDSFAVFLR